MAPLETYIAGDVWVSDITFDNNADGTPVDPNTVVFSYAVAGADPVYFNYGAGGSPQIIRTGTGDYQISIDTSPFATAETGTQSVKYLWASQSSPAGGAGQGVSDGVIQVRPPVIPLDFTDDLGSYLVSTNNLEDVADVATSRTNLELGTAATHASTDFDSAGAATTAAADALASATTLVEDEQTRAETQEALKAPISGAVLEDNPEAPTQSPGTDNTTIATTEFVMAAITQLIALLPTSDPHLTHVIWNDDGQLKESAG